MRGPARLGNHTVAAHIAAVDHIAVAHIVAVDRIAAAHTVAVDRIAVAHIAVVADHTLIAALHNNLVVAHMVVAHTTVVAGWDHSS